MLRNDNQQAPQSAQMTINEPYRATKLWLEAVAIFRRGVPLGKHRSYLKQYENCFVANDAVGWFHKQLQERFDTTISRKQALKLLQKFYKSGIFVPVSTRASYAEDNLTVMNKETDFKDNGSLYRLSGYTSDNNDTLKHSKPKRTFSQKLLQNVSKEKVPSPLSSSSSQLKYNVVINPLSLEQINIIWKDVFTHRFVQIVGCEAFQAFANVEMRGEYICHNLTRTGKYGIVTVPNPVENVPAWLDGAMNTLATFPHTRKVYDQSLCHVNYPGLENDIFKLIRDYFRSYAGCPLLTFELYDACITTFIRAELFDFNARLYSSKTTSASRSRLCHQLNLPIATTSGVRTPQAKPRTEDQYPFNASESVEDLIIDMLTPSSLREAARRCRGIGVTSKIQPRRLIPNPNPPLMEETMNVSLNPMEESIQSLPAPMSAKPFTADRYKNPFFYETAFTGCNSPVTRVVSETELKSTFCTLPRRNSTVQVGPMSTPPRFVYENPNLELSASDMIHHPKYSHVLNSSLINQGNNGNQTPTYSFYNRSGHSDSFGSGDSSFGHRTLPNRCHSSVCLSDAVRDRTPYLPGVGNVFTKHPQGIAAEYAKSPSKSARRTLDYYYGADACVPGLMTPEGKRMAIASFRLLTLLLPPSQRKHLQLLLGFMSKTAKNEKLMLDVAVSTRALIINTFFRTILNSADPSEFDELLALRIVTFMVDNYSDIFAISEEAELVQLVKEIISEEQVTKVPIKEPTPPPTAPPAPVGIGGGHPIILNTSGSLKPSKSKSKSKLKRRSSENKENENVRLQFCSRISIDEYEDQRLLGRGGTSQSLRDLLDSIVVDSKIDDEFRRKKLIQFKKEYPHIFYERYGDSELEFLNESIKEERRKDRGNPFSTLLRPFRKN